LSQCAERSWEAFVNKIKQQAANLIERCRAQIIRKIVRCVPVFSVRIFGAGSNKIGVDNIDGRNACFKKRQMIVFDCAALRLLELRQPEILRCLPNFACDALRRVYGISFRLELRILIADHIEYFAPRKYLVS
jgi:hypothetical protein